MEIEMKETATFPIQQARSFLQQRGIEFDDRDVEVVDALSQHDRSVRKGYLVKKLEDLGLFDEFIEKVWPLGSTPDGQKRLERYRRLRDQNEGVSQEEEEEIAEQEFSPESRFRIEAHLRDTLALDLSAIEPGLSLYRNEQQGGVEFSISTGGRIDILAVDKSGKYVVVELKLDEGKYKTLGQLMYYMGWVDQHMGLGPCRGIIVAREITDELRLSVSRAPGVSLYEYEMKLSLRKV
jgi:hypothetical protein